MERNTGGASEIFAEYTLSRIPHKVRASLDKTQLDAIRAALIAQDNATRHKIDVRIRIPLFFRAYYFLILGGRDRRRFVISLEHSRLGRLPKSLQRSFYFLATSTMLVGVLGGLFIALYLIKSFLGFDFFEGHLSDLIGFDLFGVAKEIVGRKE